MYRPEDNQIMKGQGRQGHGQKNNLLLFNYSLCVCVWMHSTRFTVAAFDTFSAISCILLPTQIRLEFLFDLSKDPEAKVDIGDENLTPVQMLTERVITKVFNH